MNADDMVAKLRYLAENYEQVKARTRLVDAEDNVGLMANWLAGEALAPARQEVVRVG
jgi:hypothetical protein